MPKCIKCSMVYSGKLKRCPGCGLEIAQTVTQKAAAQSETQAIQDLFIMARNISSTLDLDALLKKIGISSERLLNSEASSIMLKVDGADQLYFKSATGERSNAIKTMRVPMGKGIAGWVAKEQKPLIINDVDADNRFTRDFDKTSGFHTRSIICVPMVIEDDLVGVVEVLNKVGTDGFNNTDLNLLSSLAGLAAVAVTNAKLVENQKNFFTNILELLVTAIEARDVKALGHSFRVSNMACAIARRIKMKDQEYKILYYAAMLHDIGMLSVNCEAVVSAGARSVTANAAYQMHPAMGSEMLKGINMLKGAVPIIRHHHAYMDGTNLADKIDSNDIPVGSRIISLLEDVEDLRAKGMDPEDYFDEVAKLVKKGSGKKYDARVAKAFLEENKLQKETML